MSPLPTFTTDRLIIRPVLPSDAPAAHAIFSDPEVLRYVGGNGPESVEALRDRIVQRAETYSVRGWGAWAVTERDTGTLVGSVGFAPLEGHPEIEIAYHYAKTSWGKGYATEAGTAALAYLTGQFNFPRLLGLTYPANHASTRVLEKLGFCHEGMGRFFDLDLNVLSVETEAPTGESVEETVELPVTPERAFCAFTDPADLAAWFSKDPVVDATVGGRYRTGSGDAGRFLTLIPGARIRFTWDHPRHGPGTVVDVRFETAPGGTQVRLRHLGLSSKAGVEDLRAGWRKALGELVRLLSV